MEQDSQILNVLEMALSSSLCLEPVVWESVVGESCLSP